MGSDAILVSLGLSAGVLFLYMSAMFLIALARDNNAIADVAYGFGFILAVLTTLIFGGSAMGVALTVLVIIWGTRLSWRIHRRNRGKPEDFRYAEWRRTWTWFKTRSFFQVFMLQGAIIFAIISPVVIVNTGIVQPRFGILFAIGILVWFVGFFFEAVGDFQLDRFIRNPENKGKLMTEGLWSRTRHPNYFGEATMWWGIWIAALPVTLASGWVTVIGTLIASPVLITYLLLKVSGVPMLEKAMQGKPGWDEYAKRVPVFVPISFKRKTASGGGGLE